MWSVYVKVCHFWVAAGAGTTSGTLREMKQHDKKNDIICAWDKNAAKHTTQRTANKHDIIVSFCELVTSYAEI